MGRRKGSLNKVRKEIAPKVYPIRLDGDLHEWVFSKKNKNRYFNDLIRKDYEEHLNNQED